MGEVLRTGVRGAVGRIAAAAGAWFAAAALSVATAGWAMATFLQGASAAGTLSAATLSPPSNLSSGLCLVGTVTLTWSATPSAWADGYELRWGTVSGGPYTTGSTTTALTSAVVSGLGLFQTYYFVVRAYDGGWRSVDTAQRTVNC